MLELLKNQPKMGDTNQVERAVDMPLIKDQTPQKLHHLLFITYIHV